MAEVGESLKDEMSAALRGDIERSRRKKAVEAPPAPEPEPQPEPERRKSFLRRLRG